MTLHTATQGQGIAPAAALPKHRPAFLDILSISSFRYLWVGNGMSFMGERVLDMSVAWLVLEMTNSSLWVGIVNGLPALSAIFFSMLGGVLADRTDRRTLVKRARLGLASLTFLTAFLVTSGMIELWQLVAIVMIAVGVNALDGPNARTLIFDVVGRGNLLGATSMNSISRGLAFMIGPTIMGVLIARIGVDAALYMLTAVYVGAFLTLFRVKGTAQALVSKKCTVLSDLVDGFCYIRQTPQVGWIVALAFSLPFAGVFFGMLPVYARDVLDVGPQGLGLMLAAFGAGGVTSSVSLAILGNLKREGLVMALAGAAFGMGMLVLAFSQSFGLTLVSVFFTGMAGLYWVNTTNTMVQSAVSDEMRGRVMSIFMIGTQMMALGWLIGGVLATVFSNAGALVVSGVMFGGFSLFVYARSRDVRSM